jgi:rhamnosyltransferase subunit B
MAKIVFAVFGSLGDLHPHIAVALELKRRGHNIAFATLQYYREKIETLGFEFFPMRPNISPEDRNLARRFMDAKKGTERLLRELLLPALPESYADLAFAVKNADALVSGEIVFAASLAAEKFDLPFATTALSPGVFFFAYVPFVPPNMPWFENFRFLGANFHKLLRRSVLDKIIKEWGEPVRRLRRKLNLQTNVEPILRDKYSSQLNLALFSKVLGEPQPDWHQPTVQCGFCFYDGQQDSGKMPPQLSEFLQTGDAPIVFTLGSAAVWDARNFFRDSAAAAKLLNCRAVLLLGENEPPPDLGDQIKAFAYAPYSQVFPFAACVVHQGGIGTTAQALRAGVPHLIMPFSHDQFDNAARVRRIGAARIINRSAFAPAAAAGELRKLLADLSYAAAARKARAVVQTENGVKSACDAVEQILPIKSDSNSLVAAR